MTEVVRWLLDRGGQLASGQMWSGGSLEAVRLIPRRRLSGGSWIEVVRWLLYRGGLVAPGQSWSVAFWTEVVRWLLDRGGQVAPV